MKIQAATALAGLLFAVVPCMAHSHEMRSASSPATEHIRAFVKNPSMDTAEIRTAVDFGFSTNDSAAISLVNAQIAESLDFDLNSAQRDGPDFHAQILRHLRILEAFAGCKTFEGPDAKPALLDRITEKIESLRKASRLAVVNDTRITAQALAGEERPNPSLGSGDGGRFIESSTGSQGGQIGISRIWLAKPKDRSSPAANVAPPVPGKVTASLTPPIISAKAPRDHRIDFLRGLALVMIFIDHYGGNWLSHWTLANFALSDAAELFVLLAGFAGAFAYFARYERGDRLAAMVKALHRAWTLYLSHIISTAAAFALLGVAYVLELTNLGFLQSMGVSSLLEHPASGLIGILTGGFQLSNFNILSMYIVFLLLLPLSLWLASRSLALLLATSAALYLAAQYIPSSTFSYPTTTPFGWFFNPLAWQMLFTIGVCLGVLKLRGAFIRFTRPLYLLALAYVVFAAVWTRGGYGNTLISHWAPNVIGYVDKSYLTLPRLLNILALAYVLVYSPAWAWMSRISKNNPLTRLGRNSLPVFCLGCFLSVIGSMLQIQTGGGLLIESIYIAFGMALMWLLAWFLERRNALRAPLQAPSTNGIGSFN